MTVCSKLFRESKPLEKKYYGKQKMNPMLDESIRDFDISEIVFKYEFGIFVQMSQANQTV